VPPLAAARNTTSANHSTALRLLQPFSLRWLKAVLPYLRSTGIYLTSRHFQKAFPLKISFTTEHFLFLIIVFLPRGNGIYPPIENYAPLGCSFLSIDTRGHYPER
jgi:hypothetical protein